MRIAFAYDAMFPYCSGGAERRFHELARRLAIRHDVHYVTWRYWGDDPILIQDGITYHGVGAPRLRGEAVEEPGEQVGAVEGDHDDRHRLRRTGGRGRHDKNLRWPSKSPAMPARMAPRLSRSRDRLGRVKV